MIQPRLFLSLFVSLLTAHLSRAADFPTPTNNQAVTTPFFSPKEALAKMHLPPGFKATVFAAEPDVQQPIALCWDERGRLWIAENYTYSDSNERFDMKLRDRILIFEDTDNDGVHDKRTVFADDLQMLTSIERGFGGVYALCPPHLLWIPTKDDKPSGPPQILLDGISTTAGSRHTFANGLKWGPDGWLYGRVGISSTSWIDVPGTPQEKRQPTAGGIWRYHPVRKIYEPYCHGTTNPWGMDWDEHGEMFFINTVIGHFWHGIRGAHFKRMHGEDPYDHIYGQIDQHADHYHWDTGKSWTDSREGAHGADALGGGHAHVGMMIYQGTNWPKEYRGKVFTLNLHGRRVNVERIEREGSGYVAKHEPDILKTDDPWFRGIEITYGPDGGVYILDWSDIGECHDNDGVHRTSGRIYKIVYGKEVVKETTGEDANGKTISKTYLEGPQKPKEADLTKLSDEELVKLQLSDNEWLVRMARWELRERKPDMEALRLKLVGAKPAAPVADVAENVRRLRLLWLGAWLNEDALDIFAYGMDERGYSPGREHLESWRQRLWFNGAHQQEIKKQFADASALSALNSNASGEPTSFARLNLASLLTVLPSNAREAAARGLLSHAEDATDHNLPLMYWFGIRDLPPADLAKLFAECRIPLVRQFIARRVTEDIEKDPAPLNTLLSGTGSLPVGVTGSLPVTGTTPEHGQAARDTHSQADCATDILTGMTAALKGWRKAKKPEAWGAFAAAVSESGTRVPSRESSPTDAKGLASHSAMLRDLNVLFGDGRALDEVRAIALDGKADPDGRRAALQTLIEAKAPEARDLCLKFLADRSFGLTAVQGLATFDDPDLAAKIVGRYKGFYPHERAAVIAALVSRPSFAKVLLQRVAKGEIPSTDLTPVHARQILSFKDEALTKQLTEAWGEFRDSSDDKKKLIATLKTKLTPDAIAKADQSQGRMLYAGICAACHKLYGEGNTIGPDLTGSGRHDLNYLIENIADPSALVAADFKMSVITLKDGRVLNGILHGQSDRTLTVSMVGQEVTVDRGDIVKQEQMPISMMPEGLVMALSDEQLRNLFAYLMGSSKVPMPGAQ